MQNALSVKSVVLVSTSKLEEQLTRIRVALPALQEVRAAMAPTDPRREILDLTIAASEQAEEWLSEYAEGAQ